MVRKNMTRCLSGGGSKRRTSMDAVCAMPSTIKHAGHDRIVGKVPGKVRLVHRHVLDADAVILAADVDHAVDQKKRIAMRQQPQDFLNIGGAEGFFAHHSSPSDLPPVRASLRNIVKVFMNSRTGTAGEPSQRVPGGTSDM